jgi:hypothetical protein
MSLSPGIKQGLNKGHRNNGKCTVVLQDHTARALCCWELWKVCPSKEEQGKSPATTQEGQKPCVASARGRRRGEAAHPRGQNKTPCRGFGIFFFLMVLGFELRASQFLTQGDLDLASPIYISCVAGITGVYHYT